MLKDAVREAKKWELQGKDWQGIEWYDQRKI